MSAEGEKAIAQDTFETQQEGEAGENEEREQVTDGNQNEEMNGIDEIDMDGIVTTEKCEGIGGVNEGYEGDQENIEMSPTGSRVLLPEVVIVSSPAPSEKTAKLLTPTGSPLVSAKGSLRTSQHNTPVREASDVDASSKRRASVNSQAGSIISRISSRIRTPRGSKLGTPARSVSKLGTPIRSGSNLATPINSGSYVETPRKSSLGSPLRSSSQLGTPVRSSSQLGTPIRSGSKLGTPLRSSSQLGTPIRSESRLEALEGDAEAGDVQEVGLDVVQEEDSKQEGDITKETVGEERQGDATAAADETKPEAEAADQKQEPVPEEGNI